MSSAALPLSQLSTEENDFHDWESYLDLFYHDYTFKGKGIIKEHHIFSCDYSQNRIGNQLFVDIRKSDLPRHTVSKLKVFKTGFYGRSDFPPGGKGLTDATDSRKQIITEAYHTLLKPLDAQGINIFKQVELATKLKEVIAVEDFGDELYILPSNEVIAAVKDEKARRKLFRETINKEKKKVQQKQKLNKKEMVSLMNKK